MKALIQRVSAAAVKINDKIVGQIDKGFVILLGITHNDTEKEAMFIVDKIANLRIFEDDNKKMNLSLKSVNASTLIISQFTLYADTGKGRRPSFTEAAKSEKAIPLYEFFIKEMKKQDIHVESGKFGADMDVEIHNSGPVTIMIEKNNC